LFVPEVAMWLGTIEAALVLQQIAYLSDEQGRCVFGPADAQQFAITRRPFDAARKAIEATGVAHAKRVGAVPRLEWRIDFDALQDAWDEWESQNPDPVSGDVRNVHLETRDTDVTRSAERTSPTTPLEDEDLESDREQTQNQDPASAKECERCHGSRWVPDFTDVDQVLPCPVCAGGDPDDPRHHEPEPASAAAVIAEAKAKQRGGLRAVEEVGA